MRFPPTMVRATRRAMHATQNSHPASLSFAATALGLVLGGLLLAAPPARAQLFTELNAGLAAPPFPCVAWGDYDGDGDLDLLIAGLGKRDVAFTTLYRNDGGVFHDSGIAITGMSRASAAWGDFDGDGDLDLAMTGLLTGGAPATRIYRNDGGTFTPIAAPLLAVFAGSVAWGDFDGDGDLDLLVTGVTSAVSGVGVASTRLYRNDGGGTFTSVPHPFPNAYVGAVAWADVDHDGRLDLILAGSGETGALAANVWHNDGGGTFSDFGANLPPADLGPAAWGDFDGDGDLDLLFGGNSTAGFITRVYRNDGSTLTDTGAGLLGLIWAYAGWADFDDDGRLDLMSCGYDPVAAGARSLLWRNDGSGFVDSGFAFHNIYLGAMGWADIDGDGDVDLLIAGNEVGTDVMILYRNDTTVPNAAPSAPGGLTVSFTGTDAHLAWNAASDDHTPATALSYNVRLGTTPGGDEILSAMATADGTRLIPALGNAGPNRFADVTGLQPGTTYWWSVQAIDQAYRGSAFAPEGSFLFEPTSVGDSPHAVGATLLSNPNPFSGTTTLRLSAPLAAPAHVAVFDAGGRRVRDLGSTESNRETSLTWDGRDDQGRAVPAGLYVVRAERNGTIVEHRVVRLR